MSVDERRQRVEHGLSAVLQVAGRPVEHHSLAARMDRYRVPGAAVAVVDDGELSWASGYGVVRAGEARPVHASTLFQAASISKAVAAVGVLALAEHGVVDLDADVNSALRSWWLPSSEHTAEQPVTLRHLLSHTAGTTVPGFPGFPYGTAAPDAVGVLSGTGGATPAVESFAAPGTVAQYSGGGSTIVQQLVSDVTGRDFAELMHDLVLQPFGMVDSAYDQPLAAHRRGRAAVGHDEAGRPVAGDHHVYPELQAAGLWTTVVDLARWVIGVQESLRGERTGPISTSTAQLMVTGVGLGVFGLGPELGGDGDLARFGHSGANAGFRCNADGLVHRGQGAVVMTNSDSGVTLCAEVRRAIADEYGWGHVVGTTVEVAAVDPSVLERLAGPYSGPFDRRMRIIHADGELYSPAPYGRRRLLPLDERTFLDEETGATLVVHDDATGRVDRIAVVVDGAELMSFSPTERS